MKLDSFNTVTNRYRFESLSLPVENSGQKQNTTYNMPLKSKCGQNWKNSPTETYSYSYQKYTRL